MRVLLLDEGWNSTLYLARALEEAGHAVTVLTANGTSTNYRRRSVQWSSLPPIASDQFIPALERAMAETSFEYVLPLTEATMWRLWEASPTWSDRVYPHTEDWQRQLLRNKHRLLEFMATRGVHVPVQRELTDARELGLPLVIKGDRGSSGTHVYIVETEAKLASAVARAHALGGEWVAQELIDGHTYLFGGLFHEGRALRVYAAEKLEQFPPRTGPAIRLRSADHTALVELGERVFRELRWTGFASADFMRRPDGSYVLLEVNPRLWGSIAGASSAGVDLFAPFAELLAGRTPQPNLTFVANTECMIFPRYLLAQRYHSLGGALRALRDLCSYQGKEWRHPGFALRRAYSLRRHWL